MVPKMKILKQVMVFESMKIRKASITHQLKTTNLFTIQRLSHSNFDACLLVDYLFIYLLIYLLFCFSACMRVQHIYNKELQFTESQNKQKITN